MQTILWWIVAVFISGMDAFASINHILIELPYIYSYRKVCNLFSKLHAFCSLRDVRNCTLSKRLRCALPNQVKLHPNNERLRLGYASFTLATVENGCCVCTRVVYY